MHQQLNRLTLAHHITMCAGSPMKLWPDLRHFAGDLLNIVQLAACLLCVSALPQLMWAARLLIKISNPGHTEVPGRDVTDRNSHDEEKENAWTEAPVIRLTIWPFKTLSFLWELQFAKYSSNAVWLYSFTPLTSRHIGWKVLFFMYCSCNFKFL